MKHLRLLLLLSTVSACAWWMAGRRANTLLPRVTFSHANHISDYQVSCTDCHTTVTQADHVGAPTGPKEADCLTCHKREADCKSCHADPDHVPAHRDHDPKLLRFSHQSHVAHVEGKCERCHSDVATSKALPVASVPMDTCLTCHEHATQVADARCSTCHPSLQEMPLPALAQLEHRGDWLGRHGMLARAQGAECMQCHVEATCTDCHSKVAPELAARLKPEAVGQSQLHRGGFLATHAMEARADGDTCLRCHNQASCENCHNESGVSPAATAARDPHPVGYAFPGNARFHGTDARAHIETCAACHDQGASSTCVQCHRVGGVGGSPHPSSFTSRHPKSEIAGNAMCRTCHVSGM